MPLIIKSRKEPIGKLIGSFFIYYFSCHKDTKNLLNDQIFKWLFSKKVFSKIIRKIFVGLTIILYL